MRPWGWWLVLLNRRYFKVKLLRFKPGGALSKQYHNQRNELWLFLCGAGKFNNQRIRAGEWRLAQKRRKHRYIATSRTWVLEIQYGDICIEEDIVRA